MNQVISDWEIFADPPTPSRAERELRRDEVERLLGLASGDNGLSAWARASGAADDRLPMLGLALGRFTELAGGSLSGFTAQNVAVMLEGISVVRSGEAPCATAGAARCLFRATGLDGRGLAVLEADLVYALVESLLGGAGSRPMRIEGRAITAVERTLVGRVADLLLQDLGRAFAPLAEVRFELERLEGRPLAAVERMPGAAVANLRVEFEDRGGQAWILLPASMLAPIRDLEAGTPEDRAPDPEWRPRLAAALSFAPLEARALIAERRSALAEVLSWKVGDTLTFRGSGGEAVLKIGSHRVAGAKVGRRGPKLALRVQGRTG